MTDTIRVRMRDDYDGDGLAFREATTRERGEDIYEIERDLYDRYTNARKAYDQVAEELYETHIRPRERVTHQRQLKNNIESYQRQYGEHVRTYGMLAKDDK